MITYRPRRRYARWRRRSASHPGMPTRSPSGSIAGAATPRASRASRREGPPVPKLALDLAEQVLDFPRHLGIHSGGMVMADRPLTECCPVEWARMEDRSVLQWDKDDCAAAGLVKFDLLGLGMLTMLHLAVDLVREHEGVDVDIATIPQEPEVYALLSAADTIGVFQVESRAQMATLRACAPSASTTSWSRWRSSAPGPSRAVRCTRTCAGATGRSRSPTRTRCWSSAWRRPSACRCSRSSSCRWRSTSPGSRRGSPTGCARRWGRSDRGPGWRRCATGSSSAWPRGITGEVADDIVHKIEGFADFGFPESHSVSFAYLVYASSWIKLHYPAEFACALLNAQPMGFYSPHTIVRDATRHGVEVLGPCVQASRRDCTLEPRTEAAGPIGRPGPGWHADPSIHAMRVGLRYVRGLSDTLLDRIDDARAEQPFTDLADFTRRTGAPTDALEALATAGAFAVLRPQPARSAVGRGRAARRAPRQAAGHGHRRRGADAPGHARGGGDRRRPLGHRALRRPPSHRAGAGRARGAGHRHRRGAAGAARPHRGRHRRGGHAPPAAVDGEGRDLRQPRGRDRPGERDLHPRRVEALPQGGAHRARLEIRGLLERYQGVTNVLARRIVALPLGSPTCCAPATSTEE